MDNNEDKFGYDDIKNAFDEKTKDEMNQMQGIDDSRFKYGNPRDTSAFQVERAPRDTSAFYIVNVDDSFEVKEKEVSEKKKISSIKKSLLACAVAIGLSFGTVVGADILKHPETHDPNHPDFTHVATISEMIERTPQNFGIGGK